MARKTEETKSRSEGKKYEFFNEWATSSTAVSKMWEESYSKFYKPWIESTAEMFQKATELSKKATPIKYQEFYDEWMKTYQNNLGTFSPFPTAKSNKEILENLIANAEESNKLYSSWIAELDENSRKTREILQGEPDPKKYTECYKMWMASYEKIFDELLNSPAIGTANEILGQYAGIPDIYTKTFVQISKLCKNSFIKLYRPWIELSQKLSDKMAEISRGDADPEAYKEFHKLWMDTYKETYGNSALLMHPPKEIFDNFAQSTDIYLTMYKSWIASLEKMSQKANELSKSTIDPEAYEEFYKLWAKMYEKAFKNFFEDMPVAGPMKEIMEPVKVMSRMYTDMFATMAKMWVK